MPFIKVDEVERIKKAIEEDPEYTKYLEEAQKEFDDIGSGKLKKKLSYNKVKKD